MSVARKTAHADLQACEQGTETGNNNLQAGNQSHKSHVEGLYNFTETKDNDR